MIHFDKVWLAEDEDREAVDLLLHDPTIIGGLDFADDPGFRVTSIDGWRAWIVPGMLGAFLVMPGGELHSGVLPAGRGRAAVEAGREAISYELAEGQWLIGCTPIENRAARRFAALCGGRVMGVVDGQEVRLWAA